MDPSLLPTQELADVLYALPRACGERPELFFPPGEGEDEPPADRWARESEASVLCEDCPVRAVCLEWALRTEVSEGVWAGYSAEELAALRGDTVAELFELREVAR